MIAKLNFQQPLHKSSVSRDPLEIIFIVLNYKLISNIENCFFFYFDNHQFNAYLLNKSITILNEWVNEWMKE